MNSNCRKLIALAKDADLLSATKTGKLSCTFVGEWNAGKTTLINALTGSTMPEAPVSTTKTVVRLYRSEELEATILNSDDSVNQVSGEKVLQAVTKAAKQGVQRVEFGNPNADLPENTIFVDTPGFNDQDNTANSVAESVATDVVVFVLMAAGTTLNEVQKKYIDDVIVAKGHELEDIFFVFTYAEMLENEDERKRTVERFLEQFGHDQLNTSQFYFVNLQNNKSQTDLNEVKSALYKHLQERAKTLLPDRTSQLLKETRFRVKQNIKEKQVLIENMRNNSEEEKKNFKNQINRAYEEERSQREDIRKKHRERITDFSNKIQNKLDNISTQVEQLVDELSDEELKTKNRLRRELQERIKIDLEPDVKELLFQVEKEMEKDITMAKSGAVVRINNLDIALPKYKSSMVKITAESALPVIAVGSLFILGPFSLVTLGIGYIALNAAKIFKQGSPWEKAFDKTVNVASTVAKKAHKQAIKMMISKSLHDYRQGIVKQVRDVSEKHMEHNLEQINLVEKLRAQMNALKSEQQIKETQDWIHQVEQLLSNC